MCERYNTGHLGIPIFVARHCGVEEKGVGLLAIDFAPHDPLPLLVVEESILSERGELLLWVFFLFFFLEIFDHKITMPKAK